MQPKCPREPKPDNVDIKSICNDGNAIYGLGSDNRMYQWYRDIPGWKLFASYNPRARKDT